MKTKVHKIKSGKDISDLFDQMMGISDADPIIIRDKYDNISYYLQKFIQAWDIFLQTETAKSIREEAPAAIISIEQFVISGQKLLAIKPTITNERIKTKFTESIFEDMSEMTNKYDAKEINEIYRNIVKSPVISHVITTLSNLKVLLEEERSRSKSILTCLDMPNQLSNKFITRATTATTMLSFSSLDFKFIYSQFKKEEKKLDEVLLITLYITYVNAIEMYKIYMKPNIDVSKFVQAFAKKLGDIKKIVPDCDMAFKCLNKSLGLLEKNFDTYHMEFMRTDNPNIIFELFIADVQQRNSKNKIALAQFKKIVNFVKQKMPEELKSNEIVQNLYKIGDKIFDNKEEIEEKEGEQESEEDKQEKESEEDKQEKESEEKKDI